jgi:putative ABC transport system permease protein
VIWLQRVRLKLRALFARSSVDVDLDDELQFHIEREIEKNVRAGMEFEEARRRALVAFGGMQQFKEETRDSRGVRFIEDMLQDLRYAARGLKRAPAFALVAIMTLALGIGANTAIFSVVNGVLLQPLPYDEPENLVAIYTRFTPESGYDFPEYAVGSPEYFDYVNQNNTMEHVAAISTEMVTITAGSGDPEIVTGGAVSSSMFPVLRTPPLLGRTLVPADDGAEPVPVIVLGYDLWQRRFAGDSSVIGQTIALGVEVEEYNMTGEIVGVMPPGFAFPTPDTQLWTQLPLDPARTWRGGHWFYMIARLRTGVTYEQSEAEMSTMMARWAEVYPEHHVGHFLFLKPLLDDYVADIRPALMLLLGAVGFVLLIACANVANLMLARSEVRRREIAVRTALGAKRGRIVRQLLTESLMLAALGGIMGCALSYVGVDAMLSLGGGSIPRNDLVALDARVLLFTGAVVLLTALLFGLMPAMQAVVSDLTGAFKDRDQRATVGRRGLRFRRALVVGETALAIVLVVGAGLMVKSFRHLAREDPGFRTDNLLTAYFSLPASDYPAERAYEFFAQLAERVEALPGVERAAMASRRPITSDRSDERFHIEGWAVAQSGPSCCTASPVTAGPGMFETLGISLVRGRLLDETDRRDAPLVAVVDEVLARTYWPNEDPIGKRIAWTVDREYFTIVGVVRHAQFDGIGTDNPTLYHPYQQAPDFMVRTMAIVIRTADDPSVVVEPFRSVVRDLDPAVPIIGLNTMDEILSWSVARPRFLMTLFCVFALLALTLGAIGVYGVMAYAVTQRRHEIGIRMALGARSDAVTRMVLKEGGLLALAGVAAGLVAALAISHVMTGFLFDVSATDPWTLGSVALIMLGVGLLASYLPARHASRYDPISALRVE